MASTVASATDRNRRRKDDVTDSQQQQQQQQQVRLRRVQSAGATCQSSRDHMSRDHSSRGHNTETQTARDVDAVSKLVSRKLELYLNDVRREEGFDPTGGRRANQTTSRGTAEFSGRAPEKCNSASHRPRTSRDDDHIRQVASSLLDTRASSSIDVIHQLRPFSASCTPLNVQNFRLHFGTVLNIDKYLEYYKQQGLSGGATERNKRHHKQLLKLRHAAKTEASSKTQHDTQDTQYAHRTCEVYTLTTPRYLESSWDVAASVRHQMRSFSVDEIRKMRHRPADESYPVKVCVDVDDDTEQQQQQQQQQQQTPRQTTGATPLHNRTRPSPGTHHYYDNDVESVTSRSLDGDGGDEEIDAGKIFSLDNNNGDVNELQTQPMYCSPYDDI